MTEVVYSLQRTGFEAGRQYRNPRYFQSPLADGVHHVIVVGDFPHIVEAYMARGIKVTAAKNIADLRAMGLGNSGRTKVEVPHDWQDLPWPEKRVLASSLTITPIINSAQANAAIEAFIEREGIMQSGDETQNDVDQNEAETVSEVAQSISPEDMSDEELRSATEKATGKAPHWKAGRDKLLTLYRDAVSADADR